MFYKIVNKFLYRCDKWGNPNRLISTNVHFATFDDVKSVFLITKLDGVVELLDIDGNKVRILSNSGFEARFDSSSLDIILRMKDGRTCIIDRNGNKKRFL